MIRRKKEIAIGITVLLLCTCMISAAQKQIEDQNLNEIEYLQNPGQEVGNDGTVHYTFGLNTNEGQNGQNKIPIATVTLTQEESTKLDQELLIIDQKIENAKNQDEFMILLEEKMDILRSYRIIPTFFSLENITKLTYEIQQSLEMIESNSPNLLSLPEKRTGLPFLGIGPGVFAYVSPLGTTTPFGMFNLSHWRAVGVVFQTNVTINKTGVHITSNAPFINDKDWIINGPTWESFWKIVGEDAWINITKMFGIGGYMIQAIIGHTLSFSIAWSLLPSPKPRIMAGSFYYFGGPTVPLSFTAYKTYPEPWTTRIDIGIVISVMGQVVFPFWMEDIAYGPYQ